MTYNKTDSVTYNTYLCPFTTRYGSEELKHIWSELNKRLIWRKIWVVLAEAQFQSGLVTKKQLLDLTKHQSEIDLKRAFEIENDTKHDLLAEIRTYAEQCPEGGKIIHLGATSADIEDNADIIRISSSMEILKIKLMHFLEQIRLKIVQWADIPTMGFTHLQSAEPTTVGYRLAQYGHDLMLDFNDLKAIQNNLVAKGFKGAVGTSASYIDLFIRIGESKENACKLKDQMEMRVMNSLKLKPSLVSTQTYPRKQDWYVLNMIASISSTFYRFSQDLRILQSSAWGGEMLEPRTPNQVGSSAMPFKRNPTDSECINSLSRLIASMPRVAWDNASNTILERTLDDSANRLSILPTAFLAVDEILERGIKIIEGLELNQVITQNNLEKYGAFASVERLLMAAAVKGGDRQDLHEYMRVKCIDAMSQVSQGKDNPIIELILHDPKLSKYFNSDELNSLTDISDYTGNSSELAIRTSQLIAEALQ